VSSAEYRQLGSADKAGITRDRNAHAKICKKKQEAFKRIGHRPATNRERQQLYADGSRLIEAANGNMAQAVEGAEKILQAPFDDSYNRAAELGKWRSHPTFAAFVAGQPLEGLFSADLARTLRDKYGQSSERGS
jgi:hypothetical protein